MKRHIFVLGLLVNGVAALAQQNPTNNNPVNPAQNGRNDRAFWSRAGNTDQNGSNNIFGTLWNSPIYTVTNGVNRMKLNGTFGGASGAPQYGIDGYNTFGNTNTTVNTSGYFLLGGNGPLFPGHNAPNIYNAMGAFSLLHLNGGNNQVVQQFGYRPWMKTGITFTDNSDLSYIGIRQVGTATDITETTIAWADNASAPVPGPDDMVFRFLNPGTGNTAINSGSDLPIQLIQTISSQNRKNLSKIFDAHLIF